MGGRLGSPPAQHEACFSPQAGLSDFVGARQGYESALIATELESPDHLNHQVAASKINVPQKYAGIGHRKSL
jgi:hypothetical protein